jgi:hypothetical protein
MTKTEANIYLYFGNHTRFSPVSGVVFSVFRTIFSPLNFTAHPESRNLPDLPYRFFCIYLSNRLLWFFFTGLNTSLGHVFTQFLHPVQSLPFKITTCLWNHRSTFPNTPDSQDSIHSQQASHLEVSTMIYFVELFRRLIFSTPGTQIYYKKFWI